MSCVIKPLNKLRVSKKLNISRLFLLSELKIGNSYLLVISKTCLDNTIHHEQIYTYLSNIIGISRHILS